jgi:hypothetical protein
MMTTNPTVLDALSLRGQFGTEFFGGIDAIVGTIGADADTNLSGFAFKTKFGLHSFGASEPGLMDNSKFATDCVAEDGAAAEFLSGEVVASSRELMTEKRRLMLVREDQIPGFELIHLENAVGTFHESWSILWGTLLLPKLASGAFGSLHGSGPHFDAKLAKDPAAADPLSVLPPKMSPFCVKETLLE